MEPIDGPDERQRAGKTRPGHELKKLISSTSVVEILSKGNTPREKARKLDEYFRAGVLQLWHVDPKRWKVRVFTDRNHSIVLGKDEHLEGGDVLPGFTLSIREWFGEAERTAPR